MRMIVSIVIKPDIHWLCTLCQALFWGLWCIISFICTPAHPLTRKALMPVSQSHTLKLHALDPQFINGIMGFKTQVFWICFCHRNTSEHRAWREDPKVCKKREAGHRWRHVNQRVWVYPMQPRKWEDHGEMPSKFWRKMVFKAEFCTSQIPKQVGE